MLDRQRLGKQRVECKQILRSLLALEIGEPYGWTNHPAVRMWRGYRDALCAYQQACIDEWERRGYCNNMVVPDYHYDHSKAPAWLGNPDFHASHRAALLHKAPEHYGQFGWSEEPKLDYVWPV